MSRRGHRRRRSPRCSSGLRVKGETADEVAGAARALRGAMVRLPADRPEELVDTCGTGGGAIRRSTSRRLPRCSPPAPACAIAKHGNRSFTSQCGSADVLEALGVPIDVPVDRDGARAARGRASSSCSRR